MAFGEHDDDRDVVFPDHPPEVSQCVLQRTLCGYEGVAVVVALQVCEGERDRSSSVVYI